MPVPNNVKKLFTNWCVEKKIPLTCSQCGSPKPGNLDYVALLTLDKHANADKSTTYPLVSLRCQNCSFVRLFSVVGMGMFPPPHTFN